MLAPRIDTKGDFGVVGSIQSGPATDGLISLMGSMNTGTLYWQGWTRVELGVENAGSYVFGHRDGTKCSPVFQIHKQETGTTQTLAGLTQTLPPGATLLVQTQGGSSAVTCSAHASPSPRSTGLRLRSAKNSARLVLVGCHRAPRAGSYPTETPAPCTRPILGSPKMSRSSPA